MRDANIYGPDVCNTEVYGSQKQKDMALLVQKTREAGRPLTFQEVQKDRGLPPANNYAFHMGSFSAAAQAAWQKVCNGQMAASSVENAETSATRGVSCKPKVSSDVRDELSGQEQLEAWNERFLQVQQDRKRMQKAMKGGKVKRLEENSQIEKLLSLEEYERDREEWLEWLRGLGDMRDMELWSCLNREHRVQYYRILEMFGCWKDVVLVLKEVRRKAEEDQMMINADLADGQSNLGSMNYEMMCSSMYGALDALETERKENGKVDETMVKTGTGAEGEATMQNEANLETEGEAGKSRKKRVRMSAAEMEKFIRQAIKEIGLRPSSEEYRRYAVEHSGPAGQVLAKHGLGISRWRDIFADGLQSEIEAQDTEAIQDVEGMQGVEETRGGEEMRSAVELQGEYSSQSESILQSENVSQSTEKVQRTENSQSGEESQGKARLQSDLSLDVLKVLRMVIHGIDATVELGGMEMQIRIDFGSRK